MSDYDNPFDDYTQLLQLIEFAIQKEKEAADLYVSLANRAEATEVAAALRRIAAMEEEHSRRLGRLNVAKAASASQSGVALPSPHDSVEPHPGMALAEVLMAAISDEVEAIKLYTDMANSIPDSLSKQLLLNLAAEEAQHRQELEGMISK